MNIQMAQELQEEIERIVKPEDLLDLTHDDLVYIAKCVSEIIIKVRKFERDMGPLIGKSSVRTMLEINEKEIEITRAMNAGNRGEAWKLQMEAERLRMSIA